MDYHLLMTILIIVYIYATYKQIEGGAKPSKVLYQSLYQTLILIPFVILISYISRILVDWITSLVHKLDDPEE